MNSQWTEKEVSGKNEFLNNNNTERKNEQYLVCKNIEALKRKAVASFDRDIKHIYEGEKKVPR